MAFVFALTIGLIALTGCAGAAQTAAPATATAAPPLPTATETLLPTATLAPTATATPQPTATLIPSPTPLPPLAVLEDGFNVWCAPVTYAGSLPLAPEAPADARLLMGGEGQPYSVRIPAAYCAIIYKLNQPAPAGMELWLSEGGSTFLKVPLTAVSGSADTVWAVVNHDYVINPPFWEVNYRLALVDKAGKELQGEPVVFAKATPEPCPYGGLPDPVTLWCTKTDPGEIEPWPDVTYPYDRTKLPKE